MRMLVDLELLAHSDYLVASDHSNWSRLLQYMRYILYGTTSKHLFMQVLAAFNGHCGLDGLP